MQLASCRVLAAVLTPIFAQLGYSVPMEHMQPSGHGFVLPKDLFSNAATDKHRTLSDCARNTLRTLGLSTVAEAVRGSTVASTRKAFPALQTSNFSEAQDLLSCDSLLSWMQSNAGSIASALFLPPGLLSQTASLTDRMHMLTGLSTSILMDASNLLSTAAGDDDEMTSAWSVDEALLSASLQTHKAAQLDVASAQNALNAQTHLSVLQQRPSPARAQPGAPAQHVSPQGQLATAQGVSQHQLFAQQPPSAFYAAQPMQQHAPVHTAQYAAHQQYQAARPPQFAEAAPSLGQVQRMTANAAPSSAWHPYQQGGQGGATPAPNQGSAHQHMRGLALSQTQTLTGASYTGSVHSHHQHSAFSHPPPLSSVGSNPTGPAASPAFNQYPPPQYTAQWSLPMGAPASAYVQQPPPGMAHGPVGGSKRPREAPMSSQYPPHGTEMQGPPGGYYAHRMPVQSTRVVSHSSHAVPPSGGKAPPHTTSATRVTTPPAFVPSIASNTAASAPAPYGACSGVDREWNAVAGMAEFAAGLERGAPRKRQQLAASSSLDSSGAALSSVDERRLSSFEFKRGRMDGGRDATPPATGVHPPSSRVVIGPGLDSMDARSETHSSNLGRDRSAEPEAGHFRGNFSALSSGDKRLPIPAQGGAVRLKGAPSWGTGGYSSFAGQAVSMYANAFPGAGDAEAVDGYAAHSDAGARAHLSAGNWPTLAGMRMRRPAGSGIDAAEMTASGGGVGSGYGGGSAPSGGGASRYSSFTL